MYGINYIRTEVEFWKKNAEQTLHNPNNYRKEYYCNLLLTLSIQLNELDYKINSDIDEYNHRKKRIKIILPKIRKKWLELRIEDLESYSEQVRDLDAEVQQERNQNLRTLG